MKIEKELAEINQTLKDILGEIKNLSGKISPIDALTDEDLYEIAKEEALRVGKASAAFLQRRLSIGYAKAAMLMDLLEERKIIGPYINPGPRDVIVKNETEQKDE